MDFLKDYDIMMADSDENDDEDNNEDKYNDEHESCPAGCHCSPRVVQCSDQG